MEFGIYHNSYECNKDAFNEMVKSDYISTFIVGADYRSAEIEHAFQECRRYNKFAYIFFFPLVFEHVAPAKTVDVGEESHNCVRLRRDWQENLIAMRDYLQDKDYYSNILGLYIDEPLLGGISLDDFEKATGFIRHIFPGKRMFCCFSVAGVAPDIWTTGNVQPITPKAGKYLTDVAFDMYHKFDEKYAYITAQMKERLGNREDVRIWQIPCTMNYRGDKDEKHCIDHLNGCYELLKKENNPGGLMCFTYYTFPSEIEDLGNIGLDHLRGMHEGDANWSHLFAEIMRIGKECISQDKEMNFEK